MRIQIVIQLNRTGKVNPFKELLKNSNCLSLTECFSKNKSLGKRHTEKCMTFTEILMKLMLKQV